MQASKAIQPRKKAWSLTPTSVQAKENDEQEGTCPVIETGVLKINGQMYALLDQKEW